MLSPNVQVECDGKPIVLPKDTEGILLLNIPSYMGGVDLWASGIPADGHASRRSRATSDDNAKQSFCDRRLEVRFIRHGSVRAVEVAIFASRGLVRERRIEVHPVCHVLVPGNPTLL